MTNIANGVYRVVGHLIDGWLTVEFVRRCDESPEVTPPPGGKVIALWDDLWIDRVPITMVAIEDRIPNTLLRVTVRERTEVIHVEKEHVA